MKSAAIAQRSRDVVLEQWRELLRLRREVLKSSDVEAIHDLRVASRRFRAALELFEPWIPPKNAAKLKKNIREVTRALGGLRNIDEALLFFRLHTPAESTGVYQLRYMLTQMRSGELTQIKASLIAFDQHRLDWIVRKAAKKLEEHQIATGRKSPLATSFSDNCVKRYQPIPGLLPAALSPGERESRHLLRIAIKKWRYFFEIAAPVLKRDYSSILALLKEYQTILGRMNDVTVFDALCDSLALSRHERLFIEATLNAEDELLLKELARLIEQKPLSYSSP